MLSNPDGSRWNYSRPCRRCAMHFQARGLRSARHEQPTRTQRRRGAPRKGRRDVRRGRGAAPLAATACIALVAWQAPRLVFTATPLSEVVTSFSRHSRVQLEIGDAELAARPVSGTFNADNAEAFVGLLLATSDARVERASDTRLVLRRAQ